VAGVKISLNGEERELATGTTVAALVDELGLTRRRIAVEVNRNVVERGSWPTTLIGEHDRVEVVQFVGGGC
jgi:thiamine biosynthesis protein ThiS